VQQLHHSRQVVELLLALVVQVAIAALQGAEVCVGEARRGARRGESTGTGDGAG
jgi:hypothetical protein